MSPFNVYSFSPYIAKKRSLQNYISNHKPIHKFVYNIVQKIPYFNRELLNCTCVRRFGAKVFILCICYLSTFGIRQSFRDGPLQNLWGQGGNIRQKEIKRKKNSSGYIIGVGLFSATLYQNGHLRMNKNKISELYL